METTAQNTQGAKTAVMLFALVLLYPILAGGSLVDKSGWDTSPPCCCPHQFPTLMFVNWGHQKLEPHGGIPAIIKNTYNNIYGRLGRTGKAPQP